VSHIVGVDPGVEMHPLALRRAREAGLAVELMPLSAETLPAPDASFDSIVCTYSLCIFGVASRGNARRNMDTFRQGNGKP
jgi:ubiquinone/menaquinone biosynthesis C-methylase UbiE